MSEDKVVPGSSAAISCTCRWDGIDSWKPNRLCFMPWPIFDQSLKLSTANGCNLSHKDRKVPAESTFKLCASVPLSTWMARVSRGVLVMDRNVLKDFSKTSPLSIMR